MKKSIKIIKIISCILASVSLVLISAFAITYVYAKRNIDFVADELLIEKSLKWEPTKFYAKSSSAVDEYDYANYILVSESGNVRKEYYPIEDISDYLYQGFVAVEDHRFYEHNGIDIRRTLKAAVNYVFGGETRFGGSTITQQLIKNVSGDNEITLTRKFSELLRASHVEKLYSKDEILEVYLNIIPMGENIYGVGMAAKAYFGKEPSDLSAAEAATLIGITNAPTAYNPYKNPEKCIQKRNIVLSVMNDHGIISDNELENAKAEPLNVVPKESGEASVDSWYIEVAIDQIVKDIASEYSISDSAARVMLMGGGYSVYTNMDVDVQGKLDKYFSNTSNFPSEISSGLQYSMVVTDSENGNLLGIIGRVGVKQGNRLLNHATVPHTPASTLKPLAIYAPLIESGDISYATVFDDVPQSFYEKDGEHYAYPKNSPDVYQGLITVKDAIRLSKNTVAMQLCSKISARRVYNELIERYGFKTLVDNEVREGRKYTDIAVSPMALGQLTDGISLVELTSAFGAFPSEGIKSEPKSYSAVIDSNGEALLKSDSSAKRIYTVSTARIMNQLLSEVVESGTARQITLKNHIATAGKTGTSSYNKDKLFVGYTPYYTAGIWCGYDKSDKGIYSLSKNHIQIWDEVMLDLHEDIIESGEGIKGFSTEGLIYHPFCMDSGEKFTETCKLDPRGNRKDYGYFVFDNVPQNQCTCHVLCEYDSHSKGIADSSCPKKYRVNIALLNIPNRSFEHEVEIVDAEFVYRENKSGVATPDNAELPYFYNSIPEGVYVGTSGKRKQFNCSGKKYFNPFRFIFG